MVQNWSFEVQHQLARDLILSVGYVGTRATRLRSNLVQKNSINPKYYFLSNETRDQTISSPEAQATLASLGITEPNLIRPLSVNNAPIGQILRSYHQYHD